MSATTTRDTRNLTDLKLMKTANGAFQRPPSTFRNAIQKGSKFEPERDRYHLYVSYGCPWAHRTLIFRALKGLEEIIPFTCVSPIMDEDGWPFADVDAFPGAELDPHVNAKHIKDIYLYVNPDFEGRFTVPILWDKKLNTIVNNESSEIIRIFNSAFNELLPKEKAELDFYPEPHRSEIDEINAWIYDNINNGVYKSGFAQTQKAYENAVKPLFEHLDKVEKILTGKDYLVGDRLTEADVRLYVTIVRFDAAYHGAFKCNLRMIRSGYPAIHSWLKKLYWKNNAFQSTTKFDHIISGYYSLRNLNPFRIVPLGPVPLMEPLAE